MSGKAKFKYPLAPVLLSGQWAHDALLGELADQNSLVAAQERRIDAFTAQLAATTAQWAAVTLAGGALALERLALLGRYGGDQARQLEQARAALVELVALECVERHRDQLEQAFVQALASAECKVADDHWNMRKQEKAA
jgi:hypothetical protein